MAEILELQEEQNIHPPSPKEKGKRKAGGGNDDGDSRKADAIGAEKGKVYPGGVVLGKDGKPCRSCTSAAAWIRLARSSPTSSNPSSSSTTTTPSSSTSSDLSSSSDCPPDVTQLGRSTWTFLHTLTANYPVHPTLEEKSDMAQFMGLFGKLYPCWVCAEDFREWMARDEYRLVPTGDGGGSQETHSAGVLERRFGGLGLGTSKSTPPPPRPPPSLPKPKTTSWLDSREKFGLWMCMAHNAVNTKLEKPEFDCTKWQERWRTGCGVGEEVD